MFTCRWHQKKNHNNRRQLLGTGLEKRAALGAAQVVSGLEAKVGLFYGWRMARDAKQLGM